MRNGQLVGVVTDRDLKRASASDATTLDIHELIYLLSKIRIAEIMTKNPITVPPDYTIEEAAAVLLKNDISGAPVVDKEGRLQGIVTKQEMFKALISMSGLERRGLHLAFQVEDKAGSIKDVTDIIRKHSGRLVSILTSYERAPVGYRHVYVRAHSLDRAEISQLIEELRQKSTVLYLVDHRDNKREEFTDSFRSRV
jgi:acetoin utilization protein AcuB